ncbi:MAG TPA: multiprotein-bridging factor 1 family protein [Thermoplasmata archaeon]|nr:multiprotein-bridging factor 1 family protein [Thermoplasmata archaeon]
MICEMCGKEVPATHRIEVEGSVLRVCESCRHFGKLLDPLISPAPPTSAPARPWNGPVGSPPPRTRRSSEERDVFAEVPEMDLAPDWGRRIRVAREARSWTQEELGKRLNEKKSLVLKLESGGFRPPDATIRKVETLLRIRLRADPKDLLADG